MEMPASIAVLLPAMQKRASISETTRLKELSKNLLRKWAWLTTEECVIYLACSQELRARKHAGRKKKGGLAAV